MKSKHDRVIVALRAAADALDANCRDAVAIMPESEVRFLVHTLRRAFEEPPSGRDVAIPASQWPAIATLALSALTRRLAMEKLPDESCEDEDTRG